MAVTEYQTRNKRVKKGICSYWLSKQSPESSDIIPVWLKQGSMRLPKEPQTPVIMVGPGTGVAAFRSFIQEHFEQIERKLILIFGCRN